jgi:hypothetical protein
MQYNEIVFRCDDVALELQANEEYIEDLDREVDKWIEEQERKHGFED